MFSGILDTEKSYVSVWSVRCRHTDNKRPGVRVRWHQLWSFRLHILCLLHGTANSLTPKIISCCINFGSETSPKTEAIYVHLQVGVASVSIPCLVYLSAHNGFIGIWVALTIYMSLRTIASTWRYESYYTPPYPPHQGLLFFSRIF
jgi:hypothetical protein